MRLLLAAACLGLLGWLVSGLRGEESARQVDADRPTGWSKPVAGQSAITALTFTPDGRHLLSGSQKGIVQWSLPELQPVREFPNPWLAIHDLAFSPEGDRLAIGGGDPASFGGVEIWDWPSATRQADSIAHDDVIYQVAWQSDNSSFITAAGDRTILRWEFDKSLNARGPYLTGHSRGVTAAVALPASNGLVSASRDHSLRLWDLSDGSLQRTLDNHTAPVTAVAARPPRPGPPWVVSCGEDRTVRFWQPTIGRMVRFARLPSIPLSVAWTADAEHVVVGCRDGRVRVVSATGRGAVRELEGITGWAYAIAISPKGDSGVVAGEQGEMRMLDLRLTTR